MRPSELFSTCLSVEYTHTERGGDFAVLREGRRRYLFFQASDGEEDWKNNLRFPARAFRWRGRVEWYAHRGFLEVWRAVRPYLLRELRDPSVEELWTVGYSHGAALALLCHEEIYRMRPEMRARMCGYGFGCPRVLWGDPSTEVRARWERFVLARIPEDLVTHLPPAAMGYCDVGERWEICEAGRYSAVDAHRPENLLWELLAAEKEGTARIL